MKDEQRPQPPAQADERATLVGFLVFQRATFEWKCAGLTDDQLRLAPISFAKMSLLGMLRHLAQVEHWWIRNVVEATHAPPLWGTIDQPDIEWDAAATADVDEAWLRWREACAHTDEVIAARELGDSFAEGDWLISFRWLLTHLVEEYSRHNGHADIIREAIDGATGE